MAESTATTTAVPPPAEESWNADSEDVHQFYWTYTEEPHKSRRAAILKAHPEIASLNGYEPLTKWIVLGVVSLQFTCAYLLSQSSLLSWKFFLTAYFIGAFCNQNLFLAIHELSHNLGFKKTLYNRAYCLFANLPVGAPFAASFRPYHMEHHAYQGVDGMDTDLPTRAELILFDNVLGKAFFCTFQLLFYAFRPLVVRRLPFTLMHFWNIIVQFSFDYLVVRYVGWRALAYFFMSSFLAGSLHPTAGHFLSEHYNMTRTRLIASGPGKETPLETFSYYGPLNFFVYNAGYHIEHHDFPYVAWTRIGKVRELAPEFYDNIPDCKSWCGIIYQFITDSNVGMWCRVKRKQKHADIPTKSMHLHVS
ncbi:Sphingolipid delta(4)-desaturase [Schizosaccharomyces pombe]|uniref:Sphingolipid delta(4)-desaturase n=1 Tax=Schizosaccharomyces pombe (strain 972 / ATCC 24843) TaxID=284812 RepID=DEGS_SCHPO|nr:dihydroceramide delta-4 desaturase [Schizosaccharomyces pombe]O59715.1 RecName: Full=Sphingolipid delta(4)-desaturase; AltName: Full=Delta 4-(E)-sphingolipid desaturase; AltName: Full=Dihydroceramide desaturase [Schizosaccharomyces pombe 972h-]CAA18296.1 dihydroceramide delta-4 desaturase [Schizosaccharomyces pombe]|eukprot:NP_596407.1 dihydroceramide delta-4 desaturase [Schizosaccharomyces pombe]